MQGIPADSGTSLGRVPERFGFLSHAPIARVTLLVLGATTLAYGLVNAWRAENVTTLVVGGAALFVFALVFPRDWSELRLTWGDAGAIISRVEGALEEAATSSSTEAELRKQIDQLRTDLAAIAKPPPLRPRRAYAGDELLGTGRPQAYHTFEGRDGVALTVTTPPFAKDPSSFQCEVTRPDGSVNNAVTRRPLGAFKSLPTTKFSLVYPDDFPGSMALEPGRYDVEWRPASAETGIGSQIALALAAATRRPYATDSFTVAA